MPNELTLADGLPDVADKPLYPTAQDQLIPMVTCRALVDQAEGEERSWEIYDAAWGRREGRGTCRRLAGDSQVHATSTRGARGGRWGGSNGDGGKKGRRRKLPKRVKVGCRDYRLVEMSTAESDGLETNGECRHAVMEIAVVEGLSAPRKAKVLLHEILPGIWIQWEMRHLKNRQEAIAIVSALNSGLCAVIRNNPGLMKRIEKGLRK